MEKDKVVAVDFGEKKSGTAVGNLEFKIPFPREVFLSEKKLFDFIEKENSEFLIIGNPIFNGKSLQEEKCKNFLKRCEKKFPEKKILLIDERFSSKIAKKSLSTFGIKEKKQKHLEDSVSASLILETFFEVFARKTFLEKKNFLKAKTNA